MGRSGTYAITQESLRTDMGEKNAKSWNTTAEQEAAKKLKGSKPLPKLKGMGTVSGASKEQRRKAKES